MAGEDSSQKTEEPTSKRMEDARKKGQVAVSKEINNLMCLVAVYILLKFYWGMMLEGILGTISLSLENIHAFDVANSSRIFRYIFWDMMLYMLVPFMMFMMFGILSGAVQNGIMITWSAIEPKLDRVSIFGGFKRLFSSKSVVEFIKGLLKIVIVGYVGYIGAKGEIGEITHSYDLDVNNVIGLIAKVLGSFLMGVTSVMLVIAVIDLLYQRYALKKSLMMTKQEIKDELKQTEGSPEIKAKLKKLRNDLLNQNLQNDVPKADVIITNPTHYAVGLQYEVNTMPAPKVVVKGRDEIAEKIKQIAYDKGIATVENKLLAQELYRGTKVDEYIPEEHYKAVAEVINYVWSLRNKRK